jgi:hypothetical protein
MWLIYLLRASEPSDILWENYGIGEWERFHKQNVTWLLTFLIIGLCAAILYGLSVA